MRFLEISRDFCRCFEISTDLCGIFRFSYFSQSARKFLELFPLYFISSLRSLLFLPII